MSRVGRMVSTSRRLGLRGTVRALRGRLIDRRTSGHSLWCPPGHFYSPLPSVGEIESDAERIWRQPPPAQLEGIDLRLDEQVRTLARLAEYHDELPTYGPVPIDGFRFRTENGLFGLADAAQLYAFIRLRQPRRIIEVGSGFSSAAMLDTSQHFLDEPPLMTFIDPHPERLHSVLRPEDRDRVEILGTRVQEVGLERFEQLGPTDILLIDSSHVAKTGSDVNHLYFEVLPRLAPGVLVHIHDIGFPFEYPRAWVREGRAWNEAYLLRSFLTFNPRFRIELWNGSLRTHRPDAFLACPNFRGGSQIWISRVDEVAG
jgi:predicted O-methyltransferase YrrM